MKSLKSPVALVAVLTFLSLPSFAKTAAQIQAEASKQAAKAELKEGEAAATKYSEKAALEKAEANRKLNQAAELENKAHKKALEKIK